VSDPPSTSEQPESACPACGGELRDWITVPSSEPALGDERFALRRCLRCGTAVTMGEPPPALHETGAYRPGAPRLYDLVGPLLRAYDAQRLALLRDLAPPGSALLDVGAGRGRFVAAASAAGYRASGIEPSERGVAAARQIGATVSQAAVERAEVEPASLDAATLWHVLEHLDDPGAAVARIAEWLRPGGTLLVGVPNLESLQARLGGGRWYHLDVPRHRVHFTPAGLSRLLNAHGFTVLRIHHVLLEHNPFGLWQSVVNRVTTQPSYLYNLLKRNADWRAADLAVTAAALPLAPLAALAELAAGAARRGGTVAVLAARNPR
jgi:2-polyprenyl-3-methyl-5-hydroxy-6-metoxy-1,4-benzoquinol methylase